MRNVLVFVMCVGTLCALLLTSGCGPNKDTQDIEDSFNTWFDALLTKDPTTVLKYTIENSLSHFDQVRTLAVDADKAKMMNLPGGLFWEVVTARNRAKRADLEKLSASGFLSYAVAHGWYGSRTGVDAADLTLTKVHSSGESADAILQIDGRTTTLKLYFEKKGEIWQVDADRVFSAFDSRFEALAKRTGMSVQDLIITVEENATGKTIDLDKIYSKMK